ncbi:hypothetical protein B0H14DRAFT_2658751 [Mycena olivaceomarginata]|nr:hypothetical protein B0H14DRAFT_2658751 [Mycena olivaceomarginata]
MCRGWVIGGVSRSSASGNIRQIVARKIDGVQKNNSCWAYRQVSGDEPPQIMEAGRQDRMSVEKNVALRTEGPTCEIISSQEQPQSRGSSRTDRRRHYGIGWTGRRRTSKCTHRVKPTWLQDCSGSSQIATSAVSVSSNRVTESMCTPEDVYGQLAADDHEIGVRLVICNRGVSGGEPSKSKRTDEPGLRGNGAWLSRRGADGQIQSTFNTPRRTYEAFCNRLSDKCNADEQFLLTISRVLPTINQVQVQDGGEMLERFHAIRGLRAAARIERKKIREACTRGIADSASPGARNKTEIDHPQIREIEFLLVLVPWKIYTAAG